MLEKCPKCKEVTVELNDFSKEKTCLNIKCSYSGKLKESEIKKINKEFQKDKPDFDTTFSGINPLEHVK